MKGLHGGEEYMSHVRSSLDAISDSQMEAMSRAADDVVRVVNADGMVFLFGTGHSHLMAEEGHYRAGGLAAICPILYSTLMLHEGAVTSSQLERTPGLGQTLLARYRPTRDDLIFVFSNSGINAVPVDMAAAAKQIGMTVIAVIALDYAAAISAGSTKPKLADIADIVIDNQGPPGDALVGVGTEGIRVGPLSTVASAFILNTIMAEAVWRLSQQGQGSLPVYVSANMPGAQEHNQALVEHYRKRNPHL